jgi:dienelactone hydrolase
VNRRTLLTASLVAAAVPLATTIWLLRDPLPHFTVRRSAVAGTHASAPVTFGNSQLHNVRLAATSGLEVNLSVRRHLGDSTGRLPVIVLLGGHLTGADAAKIIGETPGVLVAAMSYPFDGDLRPSKLTFLKQIPQIRTAFHDTPAALQLTLDYLLSRPDVDPARVHGVGVSLGAPFMTIAGALDRRFTHIWSLHGSGGSYAPLEASMRRSISIAPLRYLGAAVANVIIAGPQLAPERWVARIAPRPFIMVNATDDERMPREAVDRLYESAKEPKEQIWMSGHHIHADQATIQRLVGIVLSRVTGSSAD